MTEPRRGLSGRSMLYAALMAGGLVAMAAVVMYSPMGEALAADDSCREAADWHYAQALKATPDAEAHFWAGMAAEQLHASGKPCNWEAP